jgi:hypothetical protein
MTGAWRTINIAAALYAGLQSIFMAWVVPAIWL